ncbi:MAG: flagellar filament capping protein FliD, partial [Pirellulaceae bacterium]
MFVDQFNKVVEKLDKETLFDAQNKITGQLFGSGEALRIEQTMTNLVSARTFGTGKVQSLADLGITLGENGKLSFDKTRLNRILESNTSDVEAYFTKENTGFAARAKKTMDSLVAVRTGAWDAMCADAAPIRLEVFVIEQGCPESEEWDGHDERSGHAVAYV